MKIFVAVLIFVAVVAHADAKKRCYPLPTPIVDPPPPTPVVDPPFFECPINEVQSECGANMCQSTCENPTLNQVCRGTCIAGCICIEGYLRDANGNCVLAQSCPQIGEPPVPACTRKHESFTDCGSACPQTCDNLNNPTMACTANCVVGCFCDAGYVRNGNGDCVLPEECPVVVVDPPVPVCSKAHESYNRCGTACPLTCDKPKPGVCTKQCVAGCFCDAGYVRDNNGDCVTVKSCPKPECKKFEIFSDCAPLACQKTCDTLNTACKAPCVPGCKCPEGLVYVDDGKNACIAPENCPQIAVEEINFM